MIKKKSKEKKEDKLLIMSLINIWKKKKKTMIEITIKKLIINFQQKKILRIF